MTSDSEVAELGGETTVPQHGGPARPRDEPSLPSTIGRYRVQRTLGAGGMGIVYAANDPELGRTVAIKLVRERLGGLGAALRERLRREAQALARLSHPNVVSIHDVGVDGDQLFIVMQYVDGAVLDDWITEHAPDRDGIIRLYLQAGRGLAAAHRAGLVHRDFKPGNVLVMRDGTARVTDFGLVRLSHLADEPSEGSGSGDPLNDSMTQGDVIGTPAYMAPEQFLGGAITAATDQFGFCVSLWEALAGARPFTGRSLEAIRRAVLTGEIQPPGRPLPRRISRALRRGLSVKAADRHADMDALLAELEPPRRWWLGAGAAATLAAGGALAAVLLTGGAAPNPCRTSGAPVDALWTDARRDQVRAAVAALGSPGAPAFADTVVARLDARASSWRTMRLDTCEASRVRRSEDAAISARRTACLDRSLDGIRSAVDLLTGDASASQRANALAITQAGVDPADCTAAGTMRAGPVVAVPPELARRLSDLDARASAGDDRYVAANAPAIAAELETAGDIDGAALAWYRLASLASLSVPRATAREAARKAATLAAQVGDDELDARAWAAAAELTSGDGALEAVDDFLAMATAAAARDGRPWARLQVEITRGFVAGHRSDYEAAIEICQRVRDEAQATYGPRSKLVGNALGCLVRAYHQLERWDEALASSTERLALLAELHGAESGPYLGAFEDHAVITFWHGDKPAGRAAFAEAIANQSRIYGAESLAVMNVWWDLSLAESHDGAVATPEALAASQRAVELATKILPPDDLHRATIHATRGDILAVAGDAEGATAAYELVLEIYDRIDNVRMWAPIAYNAADMYRLTGRCDRAVPLLERLVQLAEARKVSRNLGATSRGALGSCQIEGGHFDQGIASLVTAVADLDAIGAVEFAAQFRLERAAALHKHGDAASARKLVLEVKAAIKDDGDDVHRQLLDEAERILKL